MCGVSGRREEGCPAASSCPGLGVGGGGGGRLLEVRVMESRERSRRRWWEGGRSRNAPLYGSAPLGPPIVGTVWCRAARTLRRGCDIRLLAGRAAARRPPAPDARSGALAPPSSHNWISAGGEEEEEGRGGRRVGCGG